MNRFGDVILCVAMLMLAYTACLGIGALVTGPVHHECTVRDIQQTHTTIRTGRLIYEGQDVVCELGGE